MLGSRSSSSLACKHAFCGIRSSGRTVPRCSSSPHPSQRDINVCSTKSPDPHTRRKERHANQTQQSSSLARASSEHLSASSEKQDGKQAAQSSSRQEGVGEEREMSAAHQQDEKQPLSPTQAEQAAAAILLERALTYPYSRPTSSYLYYLHTAFLFSSRTWRGLHVLEELHVTNEQRGWSGSLSKLVGSGWRWKEFTAGATTLHELCASRTPVLAIGSNASPQQLKRKFEKMHVSTLVPVVEAVLEDFDVVFAPAVTSYGACPATLAESPGTCVSVHINWLSAEQLKVMHKTESSYDVCKLDPVRLHVGRSLAEFQAERQEVGREQQEQREGAHHRLLHSVLAYCHKGGCLVGDAGTPIALKAINALHRNFPEASQQETLAYIQKQHQKQQEQQELQQRLHSLFFQLTVHSMPLLPPAAPLTPQIVACVVRARVAALMLHQRLSSGTASEQQQEEMQQCVPSMTAAEQQAAQQAAGFDPQRVARAAIAATYFLVWAADAAAEAVIYLPYPVKVSLMAIGGLLMAAAHMPSSSASSSTASDQQPPSPPYQSALPAHLATPASTLYTDSITHSSKDRQSSLSSSAAAVTVTPEPTIPEDTAAAETEAACLHPSDLSSTNLNKGCEHADLHAFVLQLIHSKDMRKELTAGLKAAVSMEPFPHSRNCIVHSTPAETVLVTSMQLMFTRACQQSPLHQNPLLQRLQESEQRKQQLNEQKALRETQKQEDLERRQAQYRQRLAQQLEGQRQEREQQIKEKKAQVRRDQQRWEEQVREREKEAVQMRQEREQQQEKSREGGQSMVRDGDGSKASGSDQSWKAAWKAKSTAQRDPPASALITRPQWPPLTPSPSSLPSFPSFTPHQIVHGKQQRERKHVNTATHTPYSPTPYQQQHGQLTSPSGSVSASQAVSNERRAIERFRWKNS